MLTEMGKEYNGVFTLNLGSENTVIIDNVAVAREALLQKGIKHLEYYNACVKKLKANKYGTRMMGNPNLLKFVSCQRMRKTCFPPKHTS